MITMLLNRMTSPFEKAHLALWRPVGASRTAQGGIESDLTRSANSAPVEGEIKRPFTACYMRSRASIKVPGELTRRFAARNHPLPTVISVSYTHLRAHETRHDLV